MESATPASAPVDPAVEIQEPARVGTAFITGFVIAQIGAFVSFMPLLLILVPLKAALLAPAHKIELLSQIASLGALTAAVSNLAAGWASDRTRSRWGRRRPWIVAGALATALSYGLIEAAHTPLALIASVIVFQIAFNLAFAPLLALIPDRVPNSQKGWVSALTGLGLPVGGAIGSEVIGQWLHDETARFSVLALIVLITFVPFALSIRDPQPVRVPRMQAATPASSIISRDFWQAWIRRCLTVSRDFWLVWAGRCLVQTAFNLVQLYLLFYVQAVMGYGAAAAGRPERDMAHLSVLFGGFYIITALLAGWVSDRTQRRKVLAIAGAGVMGLAMAGLAGALGWPVMAVSYVVLGCGAGCYFAIDMALIAQVLPSASTVGRDLGVINLSNTAPSIAAPAMASLMLQAPGANIHWIFIAAAILAAAGALTVAPIRRVR